jgi:uncharacterized Fe-S cluster-containing radical SAM superfamily protein
MHLNITTTSGCQGACVYCPQDLFKAAMRGRPEFLTAKEFTALLPHLGDSHFEVFSFGGFSEPFDNPEIVSLFELAQAQEFVEKIWVHTNGDAVTPKTVQRMASVRFDYFDISCHGLDPEAYRKTRPFVDGGRVRDNLLYLLGHRDNIRDLTVSVSGPFTPEDQLRGLASICRQHGANLDVRRLHSRAGLLSIGQRARPASGPFRCAKFDFKKPVLLPGGDLTLCCQDFGLTTILGNLHRQTFAEILDQSPLRRHVLAVAAGVTEDSRLPCYRCEFCITQPKSRDASNKH